MNRIKKHVWLPVFVLGLIGLGLLARDVRIVTDMSFFLPGTPTEKDQILIQNYAQSSGIAMIAISGVDDTSKTAASIAVVTALRAMPEVTVANNGDALSIDLTLRDLLLDHRYRLGPPMTKDAFSTDAMRRSIENGLKQLAFATGYGYREIFPRDPTGRTFDFLKALADAKARTPGTGSADGLWRDGKGRYLLLVLLSAHTDDMDAHAKILETVDAALKTVPGGDKLTASVSGPGFFALDASKRIRAEMQTLTTVASAGVALLLLFAFRTPGVLLTIALPIAFGVLIGILVTAWIFGYVHGVAIAFAAVMSGVAADYPVHLMGLRSRDEAASDAARRIFPPMALGAGTTFVGFLTLSQSSFSGLAHMGTLSAVAILVAVSFTRFLLPLCQPGAARPLRFGPTLWSTLESRTRLRRHVRRLLWALPVLFAVVAFLSSALLWDDDVRKLSVASPAQIETDRELRQALGLPDVTRFLLIRGDSADAVLEAQWLASLKLRDMQQAGMAGGYISATDFFPPMSEQARRLDAIPDTEVLRRRLQTATERLPVNADVFEPFLADIARAKAQGPLPAEALAGLADKTPLALPRKTEDGWVGIVRLIPPVGDVSAAFDRTPEVVPVNLQQIASDVVFRYRIEGLRLMGLGALAGLLVMVIGRRSLRSALKVLATPLIATTTTAAFLVATGTPLNFFHLLAFVLVVSIGVDYELFFAGYRVDAMIGAHSFNSVLLCFGTTFVAFTVLGFSSLPLLHALGTTVALGAALSFLLTASRPDDAGSAP